MPLPTPIPPERADEDGRRRVRTHCLKCASSIVLDFGELDDPGIDKVITRLENQGCECPGFHVECSMKHYWQLAAVRALILPAKQVPTRHAA